MKSLLRALPLTLTLTFLSAASFAVEPIQLEGKDADAVISALAEAGSYLDCKGRQCMTGATDVTCTKSLGPVAASVCTMKFLDGHGGTVHRRIVSRLALNLTDALIKAGTVVCGDDGCDGSASMINCVSSNSSETGASTSTCTIQ